MSEYEIVVEILRYGTEDELIAQGEAVVPCLVDALKHESPFIRRRAVGVLGRIGSGSAIPALIGALKNEDAYVRSEAARLLGEIAHNGKDCSAAVPALTECLKDRDRGVPWDRTPMRWHAADSLVIIAERIGIDLDEVKKALNEYVESVRMDGEPAEIARAKRDAADCLIRITNAVARFRASRFGEDGVILVGELPKPPSGKKMYREGARRAFA